MFRLTTGHCELCKSFTTIIVRLEIVSLKTFTSHFIFTLDFFFLYVLNRDDTFYGWANSAIMESSVIHFCVHSFVSGGIILPGLVETKHRKNTQISKHWPIICMKCNAHLSTILILLTDTYYIELYLNAH